MHVLGAQCHYSPFKTSSVQLPGLFAEFGGLARDIHNAVMQVTIVLCARRWLDSCPAWYIVSRLPASSGSHQHMCVHLADVCRVSEVGSCTHGMRVAPLYLITGQPRSLADNMPMAFLKLPAL